MDPSVDSSQLRRLVYGLLLCSLGTGCAIFEKPVATISTESLPRELDKVSLPAYVVEPPDVLIIQSQSALEGIPLSGQFIVRPDGTVALGGYGELYVTGRTLAEIKQLVLERLSQRVKDVYPEDLFVDILAYNSKVFYVISDNAGAGSQVSKFPITGNETVLDALSQVGGMPSVSSKDRVWIARPSPGDTQPQIIPVDWTAIVESGATNTNYQILPGDRIYIKADPLIVLDTLVGKLTAPVERVLGNILLWNVTINRLEGNNVRGSSGFGF